MNIYVFSQALDNKSEDDWYGFKQNQLSRIESQYERNRVHYLLSTVTSKGNLIEDNQSGLKAFFDKSDSRSQINLVLLIPNKTPDVLNRSTLTALIFEGMPKNDDGGDLPLKYILNEFFSKTNRNNDMGYVDYFVENCSQSILNVKKKSGSKLLVKLGVLLAIMLLALSTLILK